MERAFTCVLLTLFLTSGPVFGVEQCPEKVRVTFPDYAIPPLLNGSGLSFSDPPGSTVNWVKQALSNTGCSVIPVLNRRPMRRGYLELEEDQTDILLASSPSLDGTKKVVFPTTKGGVDKRLAFTKLIVSFWVRKGDQSVHWDGRNLTGPKGFSVGISAGSIGESLAIDRGWNIDIAINSTNSIDKLIAGRVPVALVADLVVGGISAEKKSQIEKLSPNFASLYFYNSPSPRFYERYPEFMSRYWRALCKASHSDQPHLTQKTLPACP